MDNRYILEHFGYFMRRVKLSIVPTVYGNCQTGESEIMAGKLT